MNPKDEAKESGELFYYPPWAGTFIDQACRDVTVETSGAYDGEMFRDNFEYLAKQVSTQARKLALQETIERVKKIVEEARIVSVEDKYGNHLPFDSDTASINSILSKLQGLRGE